MLVVGLRYECQCCDRIARIIGQYDEDGDTGYIYEFESEQQTRWINKADAVVRFRRVGDDGKTLKRLSTRGV